MASRRSRKPESAGILSDLTRGAKKWEVELAGQKVRMYAVMLTPDLAERIIDRCNLRNRTVR